mgnify:CR=1 FL=1
MHGRTRILLKNQKSNTKHLYIFRYTKLADADFGTQNLEIK